MALHEVMIDGIKVCAPGDHPADGLQPCGPPFMSWCRSTTSAQGTKAQGSRHKAQGVTGLVIKMLSPELGR